MARYVHVSRPIKKLGGHLGHEGCIMFSDSLVVLGLACGLLGAAGSACAQSVSTDDAQSPNPSVRSSTHAVIDRRDMESMPQLIESLLEAITQLSSFRRPTE